MQNYSADDADTIRKNILRNRLIARTIAAGLADGSTIPEEMFLAVGYTKEEYAQIPSQSKRTPIMESELR
jgi:hypothetical protein